MKQPKHKTREQFKNSVFKRDGHKCMGCNQLYNTQNANEFLDAHHIIDRHEIANGGYIEENGISLCKEKCHVKAEKFHISKGKEFEDGFHPDDLFKLIGSSRIIALKKAGNTFNSNNEWKFPFYPSAPDQTLNWEAIKTEYQWIKDMEGVKHDPINHAEGDVETHVKMVMNELLNLPEYKLLEDEQKNILFTATLMHDIEKRSTTKEENGRITSKGHSKKGEYTTRSILYRDIPAPFELREQIAKLVRYHGIPLLAFERANPQKTIIETSLCVDTKILSLLSTADSLGRICPDKDNLLYKIALFNELCIENDCFGKPKFFESGLSRFVYFRKDDSMPDYVPYDETEFEVILMSGLPGSGKDSYINKNLNGIPVVSLDGIRRELKIKPDDSKGNGTVVQIAKENAKEFMRKKTNFVWNATNITHQMRSQLIDLFISYGAKVKIVYVETPYKKLLEQNRNREYPVPERVIERLIAKLEVPVSWEAHEVEYIV